MYQDYYFSLGFFMKEEICYIDLKQGIPEEFLSKASQAYIKRISIKGTVFRFSLTDRFLSPLELTENHLHTF